MTNNSPNSKNYIKIYFWQGISLCLRFLTLLIVIPFLSSEPKIYGVYAVCFSILIFLNYADLGFLKSSTKYAAESYTKGKRYEEIKFIGFGFFILLVFSILISLTFLFYSRYPDRLVDGIDTENLNYIASSLLLILSIFTPLIIIQRIAQIIFDIRMHGYIAKIVSIISSVCIILSTFYFFSGDRYLIVEYFLFSQSVNFISTIVVLLIAKRKYDYDLIALFKSVRFDKEVYNKTKGLAFSSLFATISWVLFYELDQIVIGRFINIDKVAIFAISMMFAVLFRSVYGIIFTPFNVRANYYIGNNDELGLKIFIKKILLITAPLTILPTVAISIVSKPLILTWVGNSYQESILMSKIFALLFTMSFITYSANMYLVAKEKLKDIYFISILMPIIYWLGVYFSFSFFKMNAFAIFKLISISVSVIYYVLILKKELDFSWSFLFNGVFSRLLLPLFVLISVLEINLYFLPTEKSTSNFLIVVSITGISVGISFIVQYFNSKDTRELIRVIIKDLK